MSSRPAAPTPDALAVESGDGPLIRALKTLERVGNRLPHPFWLFVLLGALILVLSAVLEALGVSAVSPADGETVAATSLLTADGVKKIVAEAVTNFTTFAPMGLVVTVMLGVAIAEYSGMISASIRAVVSRVPPRWLTFVLALVGVTGSVASDAIYVVLIPLGAAAFQAIGRSPVMGAVVAFTSASAGYDASLLLTGTDAILAGLTTSAAQLVDAEYVVTPVANYFFSMGSAVVLALIVTTVAELVLTRTTRDMVDDPAEAAATTEAGVGGTGPAAADGALTADLDDFAVDPREKRALVLSGLVALSVVVLYLAVLLWPNSIFHGETGVLDSPLLTDIVVPISLVFAAAGLTFGLVSGSIRSLDEIPAMMAKGIGTLAPVLVLFFAASQFVAYFKWSNIGPIIAIKGSHVLENLDMPTLVLFAALTILIAFLNFFITSGSAQWALLAPVLVPMLMYLGISPEVTQAVYRIGDSATNVISPMSPYFALALGYVQTYYRKAGIGTLLSATIPVSFAILVGWFLFFALWYLLGIPLGPGVPVR